jgi:hypothetical protein
MVLQERRRGGKKVRQAWMVVVTLALPCHCSQNAVSFAFNSPAGADLSSVPAATLP